MSRSRPSRYLPCLLLLGCAGGGSSPPTVELARDYVDSMPDMIVHLEVPDAGAEGVWRLLSNRADDEDCEDPLITDYGGEPPYRYDLPRRAWPQRARYQWHLCFRIGGRIYRGWTGYDPGPGRALDLSCRVDAAQEPARKQYCSAVRVPGEPPRPVSLRP